MRVKETYHRAEPECTRQPSQLFVSNTLVLTRREIHRLIQRTAVNLVGVLVGDFNAELLFVR